jgi:23S rRNA pseudouridine2605 synthase
VSSAEPKVDARGRPTVVSLLKGVTQRVYPVGRLDYHTRGVLILTNDGQLAARLTHPRYRVPKTYHAKFQGDLGVEALAALREGVVLDDGVRTRPLEELFVVKETDANTWVQLTLTQGLNRQVRRMGEAIGHPVLKLIRVAVADITTDGLAEGEWRHLRASELADLRGRVQS